MERLVKLGYIILLLSVSMSASVFMIIESGTFFQDLYKNGSSISFMGYWAAFLNEVFMGIMAAVWIPSKKSNTGDTLHPINIFFKTLLLLLFVTTVCGSSLNTIYPLIGDIQAQSNHKKVIQILQSQVEDNDRSLDAFVQQNQRANAALSVRNQAKIKEELKGIMQRQNSSFTLWLEVFVVVLIRFGVQLANLSCVWLASWLYRQPTVVESQTARLNNNTPSERLTKTVVGLNGAQQAEKKPGLQIQPQNYNTKTLHQIRTSPISSKTMGIPRNDKSSQQLRTIDSENAISANVTYSPIRQPEDSKRILDIRSKIAQLLQSRNEGISLSQVGKAIGEKEAKLREIVDPKARFGGASVPTLENILNKIESLYNEEQAQMI
jgi:hypothetical protein